MTCISEEAGAVQRLIANNRAGSVIATGITADSTQITIRNSDNYSFASPEYRVNYAVLVITDAATGREHEYVKMTRRSGNVLTVQRGFLGSAARQWESGALIRDAVTTGLLDAMYAEFDCVEEHIAKLELRMTLLEDRVAGLEAWRLLVDAFMVLITHSTIRNETANRGLWTAVSNNTGRDMYVSVMSAAATTLTLSIGGFSVSSTSVWFGTSTETLTVCGVVPNGVTYMAYGDGHLYSWTEVS